MHGSPQVAARDELLIDPCDLLCHNDIATELALVMARRQPGDFLRLMPAFLSSKRMLAKQLDEAAVLDVTTLPYDQGFIQFLRNERSSGKRLILASGDHPDTSRRIARHLDLFDGMSTDHADDATAYSRPARRPVTSGSGLREWFRALRIHQWLKNLLVLIPLIASHNYTEPLLLFDALIAVFCFGLMASGVYVVNDLLDVADDRHHLTKRNRPLAAGRVSILSGLAVVPVLVASSLLLGVWLLPPMFSLSLAVYLALTLGYSLTLKRRMVVDVVALAGLYTLRIVAGGLAVGVPLSFWLLAFSMFLFLSLALVKRYAELFQVRAVGSNDRARGRGYWPDDLEMIASLGTSAGYMAVLVLALYVNDPATMQLYMHPQVIWFACPLLLMWISRVWMLAHRGHMNEDPLIFAVRDRISLVLGGLLGCVFWAAR